MDTKKIVSRHRRKLHLAKLYKYSIYSALLFFSLYFIMPFFVSWDKYQDKIIKTLEDVTGGKVVVYGKTEGNFTLSEVSVSHVKIIYDDENQGMSFASIKKLTVSLSLFSFLSPHPTITEIIADELLFSVDHAMKLFSGERDTSYLPKLTLINSKMNIMSDFASSTNYVENIHGQINLKKGVYLKTSALLNNNPYEIYYNKSDDSFDFNISSDLLNLNFSGSGTDKIEGHLEATGQDPGRFIATLLNIKLDREIDPEAFVIKGDLVSSKTEFQMNNLSLLSDQFDIKTNISGKKDGQNTYNVEIISDKLNLEEVLGDSDQIGNRDYKKILEYFEYTIPKDLLMKIKVQSNGISYNKKFIKSLSIDGKIENGRAIISPISIEAGDGTTLMMDGIIYSNEIRSKFEGMVELKGKNIQGMGEILLPKGITISDKKISSEVKLKSRVSIQPAIVSLYEIDFHDDNTKVEGMVTFRTRGKKKRVTGSLNIDTLNLEKYNYDIKYKNDDIIPWIRSINSESNIDFNIKNLLFKEDYIENVGFMINTDIGTFNVLNINVDSEYYKIKGKSEITAKSITPSINIKFNADKFDTKIMNGLDIYKISKTGDKVSDFSWSQKYLGSSILENVDAKINITADSVYSSGIPKLQNFSFNGRLQEGMLSIKECNGNLNSGKLLLLGSLGVGRIPSIQTSFALNGMKLSDISNNYIDGYASLNGMLSGSGKSLHEIMSSLNGKLNIVGKSITLKGFEINKLVNSISLAKNKAELISLLNESTEGGQTKLNDLKCNFEISNGIGAASYSLFTDRTSASGAAHLYFDKLVANNVTKWNFRTQQMPEVLYTPVMKVKGNVLSPEIYFDISSIEKELKNQMK